MGELHILLVDELNKLSDTVYTYEPITSRGTCAVIIEQE